MDSLPLAPPGKLKDRDNLLIKGKEIVGHKLEKFKQIIMFAITWKPRFKI